MKKLLLGAAMGAALFWNITPAFSDIGSETTQEMLSYCDGSSALGETGATFCTGYISGLLDTHRLMQDLTGMPYFCLPEAGVSVNEALTIIESYARRNPGEYNQDFMSSMFLALAEKFPC